MLWRKEDTKQFRQWHRTHHSLALCQNSVVDWRRPWLVQMIQNVVQSGATGPRKGTYSMGYADAWMTPNIVLRWSLEVRFCISRLCQGSLKVFVFLVYVAYMYIYPNPPIPKQKVGIPVFDTSHHVRNFKSQSSLKSQSQNKLICHLLRLQKPWCDFILTIWSWWYKTILMAFLCISLCRCNYKILLCTSI